MSRYGSVSRTTLMNTTWLASNGRQGRRAQSYVPPLNGLSVSAAAAFSTRLLRTAYTGKAMNVRRSSDNAAQDIGFVNGALDTASLLSFVNNAGQPLNAMSATAAAAFSTRLLRSAYAGACMNVRRSSDNTAQDIGFVNGVLDTASLLAFVGSGDGFVTTWYDQSGNGSNATQATAVNQPQIVASGVVTTAGSKPALKFVAATPLWLNIPGQTTTNIFSMNAVFQTSAFAAVQGLTDGDATGGTGAAQLIISASTGALAYQKKGVATLFASTLTPATGTPQIATLVATNTTAAISLNGTTQINNSIPAANLNLPIASIGIANSTLSIFNGLDGFESENIIFNSTLSAADQAILEKSQGFYYGIQIAGAAPTFNGFVTTWYDQSGNGRDVAQATAANQPQIVSSGVVSLFNSAPALALNGTSTSLATSAAATWLNGTAYTLNAVSKATATGSNKALVGNVGSGLDQNLYFGPFGSTQWILSQFSDDGLFTVTQTTNPLIATALRITGAGSQLFFNGTSQGTSATPANALSGSGVLTIFTTNGQYNFSGTSPEVVIFASTLSTTDRQSLERNQEAYYGIAGV